MITQQTPGIAQISQIIAHALAEDIGDGDVTTLLTIPETAIVDGDFIAKEAGVVAGLTVAAGLRTDQRPGAGDALVTDGERVAVCTKSLLRFTAAVAPF